MGCVNSTNTAVQPWTEEEVKGEEDGARGKLDGRGDSAVSKGTADSGVVMESRELPVLPGVVTRELPPLTSVRESEADRIAQAGVLQQERPKSSDILKELLSQGIIPVGQTGERGSGAGEAYSIILDDREEVRRRPPARLESLKAKKGQNLPSRAEIEEKIRLAEGRRQLREDELKTRLRTRSARVRGPVVALTPVEPLQPPLSPDPLDPPRRRLMPREAAEGGECAREAGGDGMERRGEPGNSEREEGVESGDNRGEGVGRVGEEEEEGEWTQVEELRNARLLTVSEELESDSSFQRAEDKEEIF